MSPRMTLHRLIGAVLLGILAGTLGGCIAVAFFALSAFPQPEGGMLAICAAALAVFISSATLYALTYRRY